MQICRHRKSIHEKLQIENVFLILFGFLQENEFLPMTFDKLFVLTSQIFGLLSHSGKALDGDLDFRIRSKLLSESWKKRRFRRIAMKKNWKEFISRHKYKQERETSKRHWPHRYELIDFPCLLHSFDLADFLFVWLFSFNFSDNLHGNISAIQHEIQPWLELQKIHLKFSKIYLAMNNQNANNFAVNFRQKRIEKCCAKNVIWYFH